VLELSNGGFMSKKEMISQLNALLSDCEIGVDESMNWDKHTWAAMAEIVQTAIDYVNKTEE
jgi:hypothetical protein